MITADQITLHLIGDYILQSDWMAQEKVKRAWPCLVHCWFYSIGFTALTLDYRALIVIFGTHYLIDRYRLARYVVWFKNKIAPKGFDKSWTECNITGYPNDRPAWLTVWLLIIADNILHIVINGVALRYL